MDKRKTENALSMLWWNDDHHQNPYFSHPCVGCFGPDLMKEGNDPLCNLKQ